MVKNIKKYIISFIFFWIDFYYADTRMKFVSPEFLSYLESLSDEEREEFIRKLYDVKNKKL